MDKQISNASKFIVAVFGHNAKGQYRRTIKTVYASTDVAAHGYLAENGEAMVKRAGLKDVTFAQVMPR